MPDFPQLEPNELLQRLDPPSGPVPMVLDTDTYNEIDDQFALVYSLLSPESIKTEAVYAAPFHNKRSSGPGDGMEKSYEEILRVLDRMKVKPDGLVYKGSDTWLPDRGTPVESAAAQDLVDRALKSDETLYVAAIGAITNVASAILLEPKIREKIVIVWLGGQPSHWPTAREFNLAQDIPASQVIFDSGVPLVRIPCLTVSEQLRTTVPEMDKYVKGKGAIDDYLYEIFYDYQPGGDRDYAWSKVIWDIAAQAFIINAQWTPANLVHSPVLNDNGTWSIDRSRHFIREVFTLDRDLIFADLFRKLEGV